ncbi:hypothetical protein [Nocardia terpenica]|uniref:Uncharacterized protein n=1 Tax=Nocardia terpenica TaxID=455432 RepID=A0A291RPP1_9NOCA|nr:hypothetical protein [Nocardia terpenica]ATL69238.1 hypothetical protein CRH09_26750 [Nocardia terpenica]
MSVGLHIRHGSPWWESPDIWVVPGQDPNGSPGQPVAGQRAYLWARVWADQAVSGVQVDFWVTDPSMQIRKSTATHIGSAYADIPAGGSREVLCLTPWNVTLINGGHECIVVEASSSADPLDPTPADPDLLDASAYPQIAQRNLSVLPVGAQMRREVLLTIGAGVRRAETVEVTLEPGDELPRHALATLGVRADCCTTEKIRATLTEKSMCGAADQEHLGDGQDEPIRLTVAPGTAKPVYVNVATTDALTDGEYGLVRIVERAGDRVVGGVTLVVVGADDSEE